MVPASSKLHADRPLRIPRRGELRTAFLTRPDAYPGTDTVDRGLEEEVVLETRPRSNHVVPVGLHSLRRAE